VSDDSVHVDLQNGRAEYSVTNLHLFDFQSFPTNYTKGGITTPGVVSFRVTWETTGPATVFNDPNRPLWRNAAPAIARMEWTGRSGDFEFRSGPIATSSSAANAAFLGEERNGSQY
jgi:hypothetical protein